jgi:hypothetical protein
MSTTITVVSPPIGSPVIGVQDKVLAAISNRDFVVITILSAVGILMAILLAVYLGPLDDPSALLFQVSETSQIKVAQNSSGLASASPGKGNADRTDVTGAVTPPQSVPGADGVELADGQPLMATGLDLNGPPRRFSTKEIMRNIETPGF